MKRTVPLLITAIAGFVLIISFFLPAIQEWGEVAAVWFDILASIAFILGGGNLLKLHLKAISDKDSGWGYSAITLVAFIVTLAFGLLKLGSPPTANVEFYGETFVKYPISAMPEYRVEGSLPVRADGEPIPPSVRRQLKEENGQLVFKGWMKSDQKNDLLEYRETLEWHDLVEQLFDASQPPDALQGQVNYYPNHESLSVIAVLSDELESALSDVLPANDQAQKTIAELKQRSSRKTSINANSIPEGFTIPDDLEKILSVEGTEITLTGPMDDLFRRNMIYRWAEFEPAMPFTDSEEAALKERLESAGAELTEDQLAVFEKFFAAEWDAKTMIAAINTAGIPSTVPKTAGELLKERDAGVEELEPNLPVGEPSLLNATQEQSIVSFVEDAARSTSELIQELKSRGTLTRPQENEVQNFVNKLPRRANELKSLGLQLIAAGPLSSEQRRILFQPAAELHAWEVDVNRLFYASHQVKYAWSGDYSAQGNPFWWIYEYVLQPLMTTTFAVLAFYVASAAFRAFRAKNLEATLLLGTAFIVLLGRTYLGVQLTAWIPDALSAFKIDQLIVYIMKIFNTAGNRAIMIGIALGIASTSLKVLLGIDRSYLGSGDD